MRKILRFLYRLFLPPSKVNTVFSYEDVERIIRAAEQKYPVDTWCYHGFHIWPMIRIELSFALTQFERRGLFLRCWLGIASFLRKLIPSDKVCPEPLPGDFKEKFPDVTVAYLDETPIDSTGRQSKDMFFLNPFRQRGYGVMRFTEAIEKTDKLPFPSYALDFEFGERFAEPLPPWYADYCKIYASAGLPANKILDTAASVVRMSEFYYEELRKTNLKLLLIECWYSPIVYALELACRKLGIVTVDVQHGLANRHHPSYGFWTKIPDGGYEIMPMYFWRWSQKQLEEMTLTCPDLVRTAGFFVGGNQPLYQGLKDAFHAEPELYFSFRERLKGRTVIALCLSRLDTERVEQFIAASKQAPGDFFWLFRFHPQDPNRDFYIKLLEQKVTGEFADYTVCNSLSIYELLSLSHVVVSDISTVLQEGLAFGRPGVVLCQDGCNMYREDIADGVVLPALNEADFLNALGAALKISSEKCVAASQRYFCLEEDAEKAIDKFIEEIHLNKN
ncbi:MAG: glycosyltransferase [Lentisphaeria bacterium]|nr:glycosyltransferase [Lentisphaeria bacterium]